MSSSFSSITYNAVAKGVTMGIQLVITTTLARTLGSDDYGVMGVAMIVIGFLARFDDIGMCSAVVQTRTCDRSLLATAQTLNLILAAALFAASQIAAPFTGGIFKNEAIPAVVHLLGLTFLVSAIGFLPMAMLTRNMEFAKLRGATVAGTLVRGVIAVVLAYFGYKYWSLVFGVLVGSLISAVLLRTFLRVHVGWHFDLNTARQLLKFGVPVWGAGMLSFAVVNADNFVIGSVSGTSDVGYYAIAITWSTFVCGALGEVVHSVLFPRLSQLQTDRAMVTDRYLRTLQGTVFVACMANAALFVAADGFLFSVLGKGTDRWMPCLDPLRILCLYGVVRATLEPLTSVAMALDRSRFLFRANLVSCLVEIGSLPFAIHYAGLIGVATVVTVANALQWLVWRPFIQRELGVTGATLSRIAVPGIVAALAGIFVARVIPVSRPLEWSAIVVRGLSSCATFAVVHELLTRGAIISETRRVLAHLRQRAPAEALVSS